MPHLLQRTPQRALAALLILALLVPGAASALATGQSSTTAAAELPVRDPSAPDMPIQDLPVRSPPDGAEPAANPVQGPSRPLPAAELASLPDFLDGVIAAQRRTHRIPGVAVALVTADGPLLLKGWGYADLAARRHVDPDRTLFRIGSITKTFTWAAVDALADRGALNLDADVDEYLTDVQVPLRDGRPVTLADLMSHSGGFEEQRVGTVARDADAVAPLGRWLAEHQPALVYPPGTLPAYSNYGTALAGHVLEQVTGQPWADLIASEFLGPLGMTRTVPGQRIPDALADDVAIGYRFLDGSFRPQAVWYIQGEPAGAMSSTAADMARWLRMLLAGGSLDGREVMTPGAAALLQAPLRQFDPLVPPLLHGFMRMDRGGEVIYGHTGSLGDMVSLLALLPERGLGLFAVYNSDAEAAPGELLGALVQRLDAPQLPAPVAPPADFAARADRYVGEYAPTRRNQTTFEKIAGLSGGVLVAATDDGHLVTRFGPGQATRWVETAPDQFRAVDGFARLAFTQTDSGHLRMWLSTTPEMAFEQRTGLTKPSLHRLGFAACATVFFLALLGWPLAAMRSGERLVFGRVQRLPGGAVALAWVTAALGLLGVTALGLGFAEGNALLFGVPDLVRAGLWLNLLFALGAAATLVVGVVVLSGSAGTPGQRLRLFAVGLAGAVQTVLLLYWNLLPWNLP